MAAKNTDTQGTTPNLPSLLPEGVKGLAIFNPEVTDIASIIADNMGGDRIQLGDLDKIACPAGGGLVWKIPTLEGVKNSETLDAIIVFSKAGRAFWSKEYGKGGDKLPDCFSDDCEVGHGKPGGNCHTCPYNEFGSKESGGKACRESVALFLLLAGSEGVLPTVLRIPPSGLKPFRRFRAITLTKAMARMQHVITRITLEPAKNQGNIDYSQMSFQVLTKLPKDAHPVIDAYVQSLAPLFTRPAAASDFADGPSRAAAPDDEEGPPPADVYDHEAYQSRP